MINPVRDELGYSRMLKLLNFIASCEIKSFQYRPQNFLEFLSLDDVNDKKSSITFFFTPPLAHSMPTDKKRKFDQTNTDDIVYASSIPAPDYKKTHYLNVFEENMQESDIDKQNKSRIFQF